MFWRLASVLAVTSVSTLLLAQASPTNAPVLPASFREPQLLPSQDEGPSQGKCGKRHLEWARVSLDIGESGTAQRISLIDASKPGVKDLAVETVSQDRFAPAEQGGKPITVRWGILVEMYACTDKIKLPDGRKEEQVRFEKGSRQTLYMLTVNPFQNPGVYRVSGGHISAPVAINQPQAKYTDEARKEHVEGEVYISLVVDANGMPQNPHIVKPLPAGLDEAALEAVRKYRFQPAMKDGKAPVPVMVTIAVNFRLY